MSFGQTNGIPQGSSLMDFVAEIVLGYADQELFKILSKYLVNKKYHILRYRDDYRIFVNDVKDGDIILKCLSEVLLSLGFRLNVNKTNFSDDVVLGSIKKDKIDSLVYENVPKKLSKEELLRQLLIVQYISKNNPNAGTLKNRLSKILDAIKPSCFLGQEENIASILTDIAYCNPNTFPLVATLISNCIEKLTKKQKEDLVTKIQVKLCSLANIGLLEIWIQRIALGIRFKLTLKENLCHIVEDINEKLFETDWMSNQTAKKIIDDNNLVEKSKLRVLSQKIDKREVQVFSEY